MGLDNYGTSSGKKSAAAQIASGPCHFLGVDVMPPSTGQAVLVVYDSVDSNVSGKLVIAEAHVDAGMPTLNHEYNRPVIANYGIYCTFTGTGAEYIIRFGLG